MKLNRLSSALAACALISLAAPWNVTQAANHNLSQVGGAVTNGFEWVDLTVNVDWDFTANVKHFNDTSLPLDKAFIHDRIKQVARSIFVMTNGRQKLRNVYVFNNKEFGENVDIQLLNKEGRAYASGFSGYGFEGFSTYNFLGMNMAEANQPQNVQNEGFLGQVVAHELGHYFYGFADEYVEAGKALSADSPGSPSGEDTARDTIMNNHEGFARLSTAADYDANTKTAQGRVYQLDSSNRGASAWETLIRDPKEDSATARSDNGHAGRRKWYAAFKGLSVPTIGSLKANSSASSSDVTGYDSDLKVVFKSGNTVEPWDTNGKVTLSTAAPSQQRKVILIDRSLPQATLAEAISTAQGLLSQAQSDYASKPVAYAVVVRPAQSGLNLPTALSASASDLTNLRSALSGITADTSGATFDLSQGYAAVRANLLVNQDNSAFVDSLEVITRQGATAAADLGDTARKAKVALNIVGLKLPASAPAPAPVANTVPLTEVAKTSGGDYNTAKTGAEALKDMSKAASAIEGKVFNLIDMDSADALAANGSKKFDFFKSAQDYDGNLVLTFRVDATDASKLTFFVGKKGIPLTDATVLSGANVVRDNANGTITITLVNGLTTGNFEEWEVEVRSNAAMTEGIEFDVAGDASSASNPISLSANLVGGSASSITNPVITARFGGRLPIRGGTVTVDVTKTTDGTSALQGVAMVDDGTGADERANDGVYTVSLADKLPAGDYVARVVALTVPGTSKFNPNQIQAFGGQGAAAETTIADEIQRLAEVEFTLASGAKGVQAGASTSTNTDSGGGGCTALPGQTDPTLPGLVLGAATWAAWRRRQRG
jgi:hypothetical protein